MPEEWAPDENRILVEEESDWDEDETEKDGDEP